VFYYKTRKALGERRPPTSILIRHNVVVPFKAMLTQITRSLPKLNHLQFLPFPTFP